MFKLASSCSLLSLVMVIGLVGCGAADEDVDQSSQLLVTDGVEAVSTNDQATDSLTDSSFEAVPSADPAMAADALVAAPAEPVDTGCRSRAKDPNDPNTVIITLTNCKGRFGRHSVSGTEIVHFTKDAANPTMIHADFTSQGLTMDGKAASHTASADITIDGATRHIDWNGAFNTVTDAGVAVAHTSDLTIDVDTTAKCRTRNGTAQTTIGDRQLSTTFTDVKVCRGAAGVRMCPTGTVTHSGQRNGKSITVTLAFDGTSTAVATLPNGNTINKTLLCGG